MAGGREVLAESLRGLRVDRERVVLAALPDEVE
jgi:hypothetical protein